MSSKPPPPPRPDLDTDSSASSPKQSRAAAPPPIPLRTDLGEGVNNDVSNSPVPKIPPATQPKRTGSKKLQGRPEISIISARPMVATGAFTPFEQRSSSKPTSVPEPAPVPVTSLSVCSESTPAVTSLSVCSESTPAPFVPAPIRGPPTAFKPTPSFPASIRGPPTTNKPAPSFPAPIPGPPTTSKPAPYFPALIPSPPSTNKSAPSFSAPIPGPPTTNKPAPSFFAPIPGPPTATKPAPYAPVPIPGPPTAFQPAPSAPAPNPGPGPATTNKPAPSFPAPIPSPPTAFKPGPSAPAPIPGPTTPSKPAPAPLAPAPVDDRANVLKPAPQIPTIESSPGRNSPSSQKVPKSSKSRAPPQRPKTKPVCDPTMTGDVLPGSVEIERPGEPLAPRRKKNKANKPPQDSQFDSMKDFGTSNSAFQELEPRDDLLKLDKAKGMKNEEPSVAVSKKSKLFPTVIRTKPNGKENTSSSTSSAIQGQPEDIKEVNTNKAKNVKPTVIKPQSRARPSPPPSKEGIGKEEDYTQIQDDANTGNPFQMSSTSPPEPEPQQVKSKSKPTIIVIPKAKKDFSESKEAKKTDNITSPLSDTPESSKVGNEKPKRIPSIIRPNRPKKDKNAANLAQTSRGMPEGQSQENSQNQSKLVPARKAPPRPSPPKPGPSRPGPPKRTSNEQKKPLEPVNTQARTPPTGTVAANTSRQEHSHKAKAPRPATIGKDKESENHKAIERNKKKAELTVVSSVVATKIEPSAIALYDYEASSIDELSFKAGDEIFLLKRINHEWYVGRCNGCEGMMPIKFVEIIEDLPPELEMPISSKASSPNPPSLSTMALYDFQAQSHDELTFHAGDTVQLLEIINDDWLKGQCNGITGIFPSNFVDLNQDMKQNVLQQKKDSKPVRIIQENPRKNMNMIISSGPRCKALYDYHTDNAEDLRFDKNDVIKLVERISEEWLKGEIRGTTGMFPAAYVDVIEDVKVVPPTSSKKGVSSFSVAKALHDYVSGTEGDLSFKEGDMINVVCKINDEWLEGELNGYTGIFPSTFIANVDEAPTQLAGELMPQDHLLPKGRALYDFTGESDQEMTFKAGDEILLLQQINEDWMEGELNNHIGQFPSAYIDVLVPLP